jgi:GNAT superfamily N-acetyltransferase
VPAELQIRPAAVEDCDAIGLVTVTASHSTFIGAIPEESLDFSWTPEVSAANWRREFGTFTDRGQLFDVALDGDRIIAFVWAIPWADSDGYDASVRGLYVLPTCQRRGIGQRLLQHAASILHDAGARSLEIGCIRENPSCGFYRHLGGVEIGRHAAKVDAWDTEEILFGWSDIQILI